ncbi:MAG: helix-turn-helix transcriptional regulator [Patescibacteria group bacterium]|nr:helix-turn-helix transcriptional regulator [Patescibacteria group bacterium]
MAVNSPSMEAFRENVKHVIANTPEMSVAKLAREISASRDKNDPAVSRTFLSNLLNGHFPCSIPFAEEVANALGVKLSDLLSSHRRRGKKLA